jgi:hypothetical protein
LVVVVDNTFLVYGKLLAAAVALVVRELMVLMDNL